MSLLIYADRLNVVLAEFINAIEPEVSAVNIEVYRTIEGLSCRLSELSAHFDIIILLVSGGKDLKCLLSIRDLLIDHRIILVLPDSNSSNIACAHSFRPRYLSYAGGDFKDIALVLSRMLPGHCRSLKT